MAPARPPQSPLFDLAKLNERIHTSAGGAGASAPPAGGIYLNGFYGDTFANFPHPRLPVLSPITFYPDVDFNRYAGLLRQNVREEVVIPNRLR